MKQVETYSLVSLVMVGQCPMKLWVGGEPRIMFPLQNTGACCLFGGTNSSPCVQSEGGA